MQFGALEVTVREFANGSMSMAALLLFAVFGRYIWRNRKAWKYSGSVQAAVAIAILTFGHFLRSANSWAEFAFGWLANWTWVLFLVSALLVLSGKSLMIFVFSPYQWRWWLLGVGMPLCLIIPLLIAIAL